MIRYVPAFIDDNVLPAVGFQMLRHPRGIRFDVGFADGFRISVPTVPAHRRRGGKQSRFFGTGRIRSAFGGESPDAKSGATRRKENCRTARNPFPMHQADLWSFRRRFYVTR